MPVIQKLEVVTTFDFYWLKIKSRLNNKKHFERSRLINPIMINRIFITYQSVNKPK